MAFRFYERAILTLFVVAAVAAAIWWGLTDSWLAASASVVSLALVIVFTILFFGSALERRGSQDGVDTFRQGAEFARDLMGDTLHYWTAQQAAAQRTQSQLARNDGAIVKAIAGVANQYARQVMGWADDVARAQSAAQAAQAQQQAGGWWQVDPDVYVYDPADGQAGDHDDWDPYAGQGGGRW